MSSRADLNAPPPLVLGGRPVATEAGGTRRPALPSPRAMLGGLLVATAAAGLYASAARAATPSTVSAVVAASPLRPGQVVEADDLTLTRIHSGSAPAGTFASVTEAVGAVMLGPVAPGGLLQAGSVLARSPVATGSGAGEPGGGLPGATHEVSLAVEAAFSAGGTLHPGERVLVAATYGTGLDAFTETVVARAVVVDATIGTGPLGDGDRMTVRLAVPTATDALAVAHAGRAGQVALIRVGGDGPAPSSYEPRAGGPAVVGAEIEGTDPTSDFGADGGGATGEAGATDPAAEGTDPGDDPVSIEPEGAGR